MLSPDSASTSGRAQLSQEVNDGLRRTQQELVNHVKNLHTQRFSESHNLACDTPHILEVLDRALSSKHEDRVQFAALVKKVEEDLKSANLGSVRRLKIDALSILDERISRAYSLVLQYYSLLSLMCDYDGCKRSFSIIRYSTRASFDPSASFPASVVLAESFLRPWATGLKSLHHLSIAMKYLVTRGEDDGEWHFNPSKMTQMGVSPVQVFNILRLLLKVGEEVSPGLGLLKAAADFKALGRALYQNPLSAPSMVSSPSEPSSKRMRGSTESAADSQRRDVLRSLVPLVAASQGVTQEVVKDKRINDVLRSLKLDELDILMRIWFGE